MKITPISESALLEKMHNLGAVTVKAQLDFLCDGSALMLVGITDIDQSTVETVYSELFAKVKNENRNP